MTESQRQNLLAACAFAKVYLEAADRELRGGDATPRVEAGEQLVAALRNLNPPAPDVPLVDWPAIGKELGLD